MKDKPKSNFNNYLWIGALIVVVVIVIYLIIVLLTPKNNSDLKGELGAHLEDEKIASGEGTYLIVEAKNTGSKLLEAEFKIQADDASAVEVTYPDTEMLKFKLYPQESIKRRIGITGISKAIRTDYELDVVIVGNNESIISKETTILTVTNE